MNTAKIDAAREAIEAAREALKEALERHGEEVVAEAQRLVQERDKRSEKLREARDELAAVEAERAALDATNSAAYRAYQQADYEGDEDAATAAKAEGVNARRKLGEIEEKAQKARKKVEAASFDEVAADKQQRADLAALKSLVATGITENKRAGVLIENLGAPARKREAAATEKERLQAQAARQAERDRIQPGEPVGPPTPGTLHPARKM